MFFFIYKWWVLHIYVGIPLHQRLFVQTHRSVYPHFISKKLKLDCVNPSQHAATLQRAALHKPFVQCGRPGQLDTNTGHMPAVVLLPANIRTTQVIQVIQNGINGIKVREYNGVPHMFPTVPRVSTRSSAGPKAPCSSLSRPCPLRRHWPKDALDLARFITKAPQKSSAKLRGQKLLQKNVAHWGRFVLGLLRADTVFFS